MECGRARFDLIAAAIKTFSSTTRTAASWVADVSQPDGLIADEVQSQWSLVTCVNVMLHVTHDEPFNRSLANVPAMVAPGGYLLLAEPILMTTTVELPYDPEKHSRARVLVSYVSPLVAFGLELVTVEHGCVFANNPTRLARTRRWPDIGHGGTGWRDDRKPSRARRAGWDPWSMRWTG